MQPRARAASASAWSRRAEARPDLRIDRHREHDRAIAVVDDERGRAGLALRVVEPREPDAALLAELERDLLEQRRSPRDRRAARARRARPTRGATAGAARSCPCAARRGRRRSVVTTPRRVGGVGRRERERDARRAAAPTASSRPRSPPARAAARGSRARATDRRAARDRSGPRSPRRRSASRASAVAGAIFPARAREQIERGRPRPGIADHAQLARVEQRDLHGAAVQRRDAHDVAGRGRRRRRPRSRGRPATWSSACERRCGTRATTGSASRGRGTARRRPTLASARHSRSIARSAARSRTTETSIAMRVANAIMRIGAPAPGTPGHGGARRVAIRNARCVAASMAVEIHHVATCAMASARCMRGASCRLAAAPARRSRRCRGDAASR